MAGHIRTVKHTGIIRPVLQFCRCVFTCLHGTKRTLVTDLQFMCTENKMGKIIQRGGSRPTGRSTEGEGKSNSIAPKRIASTRMSPAAKAEAVNILMGCDAKPVRELREKLAGIVNGARYQGKSTIITQHGRLAAAVVPIEDYWTVVQLKTKSSNKKGVFEEERGTTLDELFQSARKRGINDVNGENRRPSLSRGHVAPRRKNPSPQGV